MTLIVKYNTIHKVYQSGIVVDLVPVIDFNIRKEIGSYFLLPH